MRDGAPQSEKYHDGKVNRVPTISFTSSVSFSQLCSLERRIKKERYEYEAEDAVTFRYVAVGIGVLFPVSSDLGASSSAAGFGGMTMSECVLLAGLEDDDFNFCEKEKNQQ